MVRRNIVILDIKEYISSGIIESYVLGVVSDQERREVECMSHIYPELQDHLLETQARLEQLSEGWNKLPPAELKAKVMEAVSDASRQDKEAMQNDNQDAKVIQMPQTTDVKGNNLSKWVAAASIIALIGVASLFVLKNNEAKSQLKAKNNEVKAKAALVAELEKKVNAYNAEQEFITDDNTQMVSLAGTPNSPDAKVKAYWNKDQSEVLLVGISLPQNEADQQYQLWAIVEGKPVDLGMLDLENPNKPISKKVNASAVQAFAITLEKKGGSPTPNLEQLFVIGNVGS
jgi:anti-sigma-K factor RskA